MYVATNYSTQSTGSTDSSKVTITFRTLSSLSDSSSIPRIVTQESPRRRRVETSSGSSNGGELWTRTVESSNKIDAKALVKGFFNDFANKSKHEKECALEAVNHSLQNPQDEYSQLFISHARNCVIELIDSNFSNEEILSIVVSDKQCAAITDLLNCYLEHAKSGVDKKNVRGIFDLLFKTGSRFEAVATSNFLDYLKKNLTFEGDQTSRLYTYILEFVLQHLLATDSDEICKSAYDKAIDFVTTLFREKAIDVNRLGNLENDLSVVLSNLLDSAEDEPRVKGYRLLTSLISKDYIEDDLDNWEHLPVKLALDIEHAGALDLLSLLFHRKSMKVEKLTDFLCNAMLVGSITHLAKGDNRNRVYACIVIKEILEYRNDKDELIKITSGLLPKIVGLLKDLKGTRSLAILNILITKDLVTKDELKPHLENILRTCVSFLKKKESHDMKRLLDTKNEIVLLLKIICEKHLELAKGVKQFLPELKKVRDRNIIDSTTDLGYSVQDVISMLESI